MWLLATGPAVLATNDPLRSRQYGLDRIGAEAAWGSARGTGVLIAVVDTGVNLQHEDLRNQLLLPGRDFVDGNDDPSDLNGHGTHVAGIAAAQSGNAIGVAGVAPDARILPLRVLDEEGSGVESDVAAAIRFALTRAAQVKMSLVVNLSLTDLKVEGSVASRQMRDAIREAWASGAVIVAAAGNEALPFSDYPAEGPNVISVGATTDRDVRAPFSNRGANLVAPGEKILSTFWDPDNPADNDVYAYGSGTSMAAPFVSGVAALLMSTGMDNRSTVDRILRTADPLGYSVPNTDLGYGRLNAARALGLAGADVGTAEEPGLPPVAEGKFEPIGSLGAPETLPQRAASSESPSRLFPGLLALLLVVAAYGAVRWNAMSVRREAEVPRPGPWEFDPFR